MPRYTPALDGVRGIAILLVLFHHFTRFDPVTPVGEWVSFFATLGWCGVDLFFVLSGFLITGILIDARGSPHYFTSFYARRVLRIFPLYYLIVFLSFHVLERSAWWHHLLVGPDEIPEWPYWTYLVNFAIAERGDFKHGVLDVAWSLAIEEQFYLLWPAVVWMLPLRFLGWLCGAIVLTVPILRSIALDNDAAPVAAYVLPHLRADALALGALLAWLSRRDLLQDLRALGPLALIGGAGGAVWCAAQSASAWWWEPLTQGLGYSLLALSGGGLVLLAVTREEKTLSQRILRAGWLRAFGKYSYAMYLIHLPVSRIVQEFVLDPKESPAFFGAFWPAQLVFYLLASVPTFGLAWLSWHFLEAPILRLKAWFPYATPVAMPPSDRRAGPALPEPASRSGREQTGQSTPPSAQTDRTM